MKRYAYVPAALDSATRGFALGVKYRTNKDQKYEIKKIKNGIQIELEDRRLFYFRASKKSADRLTGLDLDEVLDLSFSTNPALITRAGFQFAMVNSHAIPKKYYRDYAYEETKEWPEILADSGGFQLSRGIVDFLDPKEIVEAQNQICSIGISLDIPFPLTHVSEVSLFQRAAKIQHLNNEVFKKHKREGLKLMNVFHGPNYYLIDKYRETVEDKSIDRLSIGGVRRIDLRSFVLRLIYVMMTGRKYQQYHALGVSGLERWMLLCYIANKGIVNLVTSDSSTYLQCGSNLAYFDPDKLCSTKDLKVVNAQVGQYKRLACSCPVCSMLGYSAAINDRTNTMGFQACVYHNLYMVKNYIDEVYELSKAKPAEILSYLKQYSNDKKLKVIEGALRAVDMAVQDGPLKAAKKFGPELLLKQPVSTIGRQGLFKGLERIDERTEKKRKHLNSILTKFERYYNIKQP